MKYINTQTNEVKYIHEIRSEYSNMSIPAGADLSDIGYLLVEPTDPPAQSGYVAVIDNPEEYAPGKWRDTWVLVETPVPYLLSPRQIRLALTAMGLRQAVETAVANAGGDMVDWWEYTITYERDHPVVSQMIAAIGATEAQADQLWRLGSTL